MVRNFLTVHQNIRSYFGYGKGLGSRAKAAPQTPKRWGASLADIKENGFTV